MKIEVRGESVVLTGFAFDSPALASRHVAEFDTEQFIEKTVTEAVAKQRAAIDAVVAKHAASCRRREELVRRLADLDNDRFKASIGSFGASLTARLRVIDKEIKAVSDLVVMTEGEMAAAAERIGVERSRAASAAANDVKRIIAERKAAAEREVAEVDQELLQVVERLVGRHQRGVGALKSLSVDPAKLTAAEIEATVASVPLDSWATVFSASASVSAAEAVRHAPQYGPANQPGRVWDPEDYPALDDVR